MGQLIQYRASFFGALIWAAVAGSAFVLLAGVAARSDRPSMDFHSYFTAAHLVAEGEPITNFYDDEWFSAQASRFAPLKEIYRPNVPTTALFFAPAALFKNEVDARFVWIVMSLVLLVPLVEGLVRIAGDPAARPYWYIAAFISEPVTANLFQGQAYIPVAVGSLLLLKWWKDDHQGRAGAMMAILFAYKSFGFVFWPLALITGRWRTFAWGVAVLGMIGALTWPIIGLDGWLAYLNSMQQLFAGSQVRATAYQSVQSFVHHLLSTGGDFGAPALALPAGAVGLVSTTVVLGFILITLYVGMRHPEDELVVGASILLSLLVVPLSQAHTYVLAFIPIALLFRRLRGSPCRWYSGALWFGAAAIMVPTPYRSLRLYDGWAAVIAYPKLYGALVLWGVCIALLLQKERSAALRPMPAPARSSSLGS